MLLSFYGYHMFFYKSHCFIKYPFLPQNSPGTLKDHKHDKKHKHKGGEHKDLYRDRGDRERASEHQRASDPPLGYAGMTTGHAHHHPG